MRKLMNLFLLSCKKVTELIEKKQVVPLSRTEKVQMKLHTTMCKACKAYGQQSGFIDKALNHINHFGEKETLSTSEKNHIINELNKK